MDVAYKSAGTGTATETSGAALSPTCPATVDANDILIAHVFWEGTTTAPSTPSGWDLLAGPYTIETTIARHWVYGKIADGTEDGAAVAFGSPAVTTQRGARIYSFSGYVGGTILQICDGFSHTSHATDPQGVSVTTPKAGALAIQLVGQNDNNTFANFTGESGGNWTEAVAEFTANLTPGLALGIQTCIPTGNPGTVSGGSDNTTNDPVGVIGFYIQDDPYTDKAATETLVAGTTDAYNAILATVRNNSDTLNGFADTWRLLTDNDTFTNHHLTDSLTVRLNGSTDTVPTTSKSVTDTTAVVATEAYATTLTATLSDTVAVGADDVVSLALVLAASDTIVSQVEEATVPLMAIPLSESVVVRMTDGGAVSVTTVSSDALSLTVTEAVSTQQAISITEALTMTAGDAASLAVTIVTVEEAAAVLADLVTQISLVFSAVDTSSVQALDSGNVLETITKAASDELQAGLVTLVGLVNNVLVDDTLTYQVSELATGTQALTVSDLCSLIVSEDQVSSAPTAALDGVAISLFEAASVSIALSCLDDVVVQSLDVAVQEDSESAIPKSAQDVVAIHVAEDAITELAGPYWSGQTANEPALVGVGSYDMVRKETPWKRVW